jgi:Domain of Unknown Function (DUF349)
MSFLDRFKLQPKWKHADPAVRAAAVAEVPDDPEHQATLLELAADEDVRVRRAALARIDAVEDLVRFAGSERDEDLRRELAERLVAIAIQPADSDGAAALALEGLNDQKQFAAIARTSPFETVRTAALGRIHDAKLLGGVARQAADPQTAADAVARIADASELVTIALKTDHKDAGIAALERAVDASTPTGDERATLDKIATRAQNKSVAKRARAMLQAMDEAEAAKRAALEQWQQRIAVVMARVDALAASPATPDARLQLGDADAEWRQLATEGRFEVDADTLNRFGSLVASAHAAIDAHERREAERRAEEERQAAIRASRLALCERVEALRGDDALDDLEKARAEWEGLPAPSEQALADAEAHARFEDACRQAIERHRNRQELQRIHARLSELAEQAEGLSNLEVTPQETWKAVTAEWTTLLPQGDELDAAVVQRFTDAEARVRQREEDRKAAVERALRQHMQRLEQLIDRVHKRVAAEDLTLREADRAVRELRASIDAPPAVDEREQHAMVDRLKAALAAIAPRLHELREMDEWKRFANAAVQEELIAKTEGLRAKYHFDTPEGPQTEDIEKAAHELHEIQERWKQVAEAPRAQAQALWHRYRQAADPIQAKAREFFAQRAEERKGNLDRKMALIERAEALAESTDWIKTADELKALQHEWQQIGPVPRQELRATWKRFRDACDRFFTRRNADLAQRKETWATNLAKKEALCARAEELAASRDWDRGAAEIRRMQAEWKMIGPVRRNKSEAVWQRFRAACDTFFERYKRRDQIELETKQADREALVTELESLSAAAPSDGTAPSAPDDLLDRVRSLRTRWNQTTPVVRQGADPLSARFVEALERTIAAYPDKFKGTELDVDAGRQKMEKLCARVEGFVADAAAAPAGSSQALADMLREALAANTIGGRAGEESKWRAMAEEVRQAQSSWTRLGPVPGNAGRELTDRFHRACNRFFEQYRKRVPPQSPQRGKPVGAR